MITAPAVSVTSCVYSQETQEADERPTVGKAPGSGDEERLREQVHIRIQDLQ